MRPFFLGKNRGGECRSTQPPPKTGAMGPPNTEAYATTCLSGSQENCEAGSKLCLAETAVMPMRQPCGMGARFCAGVFFWLYPCIGNASLSMSCLRVRDAVTAPRILSPHSNRSGRHPQGNCISFKAGRMACRKPNQSLPSLAFCFETKRCGSAGYRLAHQIDGRF